MAASVAAAVTAESPVLLAAAMTLLVCPSPISYQGGKKTLHYFEPALHKVKKVLLPAVALTTRIDGSSSVCDADLPETDWLARGPGPGFKPGPSSQAHERNTPKLRPVTLKDKPLKNAMKTMGPAKVEAPSPDKYLKKHSKVPEIKERCHRMCTMKKPAVPLRSEHPPEGLCTKRNIIKPMTTRQQVASVDTNRGHKALLEHSGLVPKYTKKKGYGQVPEYLRHRSEEEQRAIDDYEFVEKRSPLRQLSDEERQANLESLKSTLAELNDKYQRLPVVVDTPMRKTRKEQLEAEMKQLESDVVLFERFKTIYIAD